MNTPAPLVRIAVTGAADGAHLRLVDRAHHRVGGVEGQHLVWPVARLQQPNGGVTFDVLVLESVHVLDPIGRLGIDEVHIGQMGKCRDGFALGRAPGCGGNAQVLADDVRFSGGDDDFRIPSRSG